MTARRAAARCGTALALALLAAPSHAMLDVEDRGPLLDAGNFRLRITNAGLVGNAFYDVGRSSDPSFEYPKYSGIELLHHAELWVGARDVDGGTYVSGGPMLEWRPTLAPDDRVRLRRRSDPGAARGFDDDADGTVGEEVLNGRDDDGDGEVDEDLELFAEQTAGADYVDDRPEAVNFGYPTGETHHALGLTVHQEAHAWSVPGYDGLAALTFRITNHGGRRLRDLYLGVLADLDSRRLADRGGHRYNRAEWHSYSTRKFEGLSQVLAFGIAQCPGAGDGRTCPPVPCYTSLGATVPVISSTSDPTLPIVALVPLAHTLDPMSRIAPNLGVAPADPSFTVSAFSSEGIPGSGGLPALDGDRYEALAGRYPGETADRIADWTALVSCGPFRVLDPGQTVEFSVGLVAAPTLDSLEARMDRLALLEHGAFFDLLPNATAHPDSEEYEIGESGVSGHEVCLEPPFGATFTLDPHCVTKIPEYDLIGLVPREITLVPGHCTWVDLDCDECTGLNGKETRIPWLDPGMVPPAPTLRVTPRDHGVTLEWDNAPEVLIAGGRVGAQDSRFVAYRVHKLARWAGRQALLPQGENWALLGTWGLESDNRELPLAAVTDTTVDYERVLYEQKLYPVGRYRIEDRDVLNGFDYLYAVTTVYDGMFPLGNGVFERVRFESPVAATFAERVTPHVASVPAAGQVTVVPNPYRGRAGWDRPAVLGDPLPRHVDFLHLPKERATIKIYTVAGDFVAQLDHDGRRGDGQASWDLISRNGQDVESGIYLFTVDSPLGHQVGKFVIIR